jgi:hypothetical protein
MKYFAIENSLNEKIMGKIPQMKDCITHCHVDDPNLIDNLYFKKIEGVPILYNAVLHANAKKTDLIETGGIGFSFGTIVISDKLKKIFDRFNVYGVQYFNTYIVQSNKENTKYFQTHFYDFPFQNIDFTKTSFLLKDRDIHRNVVSKEITFSNTEELLDFTDEIKYPSIVEFKEITFNSEMNLDYFFLRFFNANKGIVSENLKNEIERNNITGIEFRPIEISYNEWYGTGNEREKIYGKN